MKYNAKWDVRSIPFDAVPDDLLKSWWVQRNSRLGGQARATPTDDPEILAKRAKEANRLREYRRQKKLIAHS